jgi:ribosomal RNA-processing protein 9
MNGSDPFLKPASNGTRKRKLPVKRVQRPDKPSKRVNKDLVVESDAESDIDDGKTRDAFLDFSKDDALEAMENESAAAKRLRLAKGFIQGLAKSAGEGDFDAAQVDRELIAQRLKDDAVRLNDMS